MNAMGQVRNDLARFFFQWDFWVTFIPKLFPPNHGQATIHPAAFIPNAI